LIPKGKKLFRIFFLCSLIASLAILSTCSSRNKQSKNQVVAKVIRRDFSSTVLATGVVTAQVGAEVRVGSRVSGKVERLLSKVGDMVKKGDIIAELEKDDVRAVVEQRKAELAMAESKLSGLEKLFPREVEKAEADVAKWRATVFLAQKDLERKKDLLKEDLTSQQDMERAQEVLSVSEAELVTAEKTLELTITQYTEDIKVAGMDVERAKAALASAKAQLAYTTINASISGVIGSVSTQEGETVAAGFNAPTFVTIIDLDRLQVDAYVDEVDIGKVKLGQQAIFTVDAFPALDFQGKVKAIYPKAIIQDNVVNYDVVVEIIQSSEGLLRPAMTASVTIMLEGRSNVLAIPAKAVKRERGKNVVYIPADGKAERREIKVGFQDGEWIEVVAGLEEGQSVIVESPSPENERM